MKLFSRETLRSIFNHTHMVAFIMSAFILVVANSSCKDDDDGESLDCSTVSNATFTSNSGNIAAILESKCAQATCHGAGGEGAEHWEWETDYTSVQPHFDHMLEAVEEGTMPDAGATKLTDEELNQLLCWKEAGFPE